jgi:hypothetical protein
MMSCKKELNTPNLNNLLYVVISVTLLLSTCSNCPEAVDTDTGISQRLDIDFNFVAYSVEKSLYNLRVSPNMDPRWLTSSQAASLTARLSAAPTTVRYREVPDSSKTTAKVYMKKIIVSRHSRKYFYCKSAIFSL